MGKSHRLNSGLVLVRSICIHREEVRQALSELLVFDGCGGDIQKNQGLNDLEKKGSLRGLEIELEVTYSGVCDDTRQEQLADTSAQHSLCLRDLLGL